MAKRKNRIVHVSFLCWALCAAFAASAVAFGCSSSTDGADLGEGSNDPNAEPAAPPVSELAPPNGDNDQDAVTRAFYENLTAEQEAALDACEAETGERLFDDCPVPVLCSALDATASVPIVVTFEPLAEQCAWTEKDALSGPEDRDNLKKRNEYTQARAEQVRDLRPKLQVPDGEAAVFCRVDISVESLRQDGEFHYDDDLLFVFGGNNAASGPEGGAVLITRNTAMPPAMSAAVPEFPEREYPLYSWPSIAGLNLSNSGAGTDLFCLGYETIDAGNPECSLPVTDNSGLFEISLTDDIAETLGIRAALNGNYNLSVVVTGDNDAGSDCKHDGFEATVNVGYVVLPQAIVETLEPPSDPIVI